MVIFRAFVRSLVVWVRWLDWVIWFGGYSFFVNSDAVRWIVVARKVIINNIIRGKKILILMLQIIILRFASCIRFNFFVKRIVCFMNNSINRF